MHEARKVANLILSELDACEQEITNLKLNKVLFFVQGWGLVRVGRPLIRNHFEAWTFGPVVRSVYEAFKQFVDRPITSYAEHLNYATGAREIVRFNDIATDEKAFIMSVARSYARFTSAELVRLTHEAGSPWELTFKAEDKAARLAHRIPNELIRAHFFAKGGDRRIN
jgi:uncharacterized phage-associated protein